MSWSPLTHSGLPPSAGAATPEPDGNYAAGIVTGGPLSSERESERISRQHAIAMEIRSTVERRVEAGKMGPKRAQMLRDTALLIDIADSQGDVIDLLTEVELLGIEIAAQ